MARIFPFKNFLIHISPKIQKDKWMLAWKICSLINKKADRIYPKTAGITTDNARHFHSHSGDDGKYTEGDPVVLIKRIKSRLASFVKR